MTISIRRRNEPKYAHLPERERPWQVDFRTRGGKRIRRTLPAALSADEVSQIGAAIYVEIHAPNDRKYENIINSFSVIAPQPRDYALLYANTKDRARRRKIPFSINKKYFDNIVKKANGRCMISQIPFDIQKISDDVDRRPYYPSIDRIKSNRGYIPGNVRLVCTAVNYALNTWGDEVLYAIAYGIAANQHFQHYKANGDTKPDNFDECDEIS